MSRCQCEVYEVCPVCSPVAHAREVARLCATAKPKSINLDDLQWEAEGLMTLLKDREPGLMSWNMLLKDKLKNIHEIIKPVFE